MFRIEENKEPKNYHDRIANILNMKIVFILSAIIFNIEFAIIKNRFDLEQIKFLALITVILIVLAVYVVISPNLKKYILGLKLPQGYKEKSNLIKFLQIILMILNALFLFFLFIASFVIQRYV